MLVEGLVAAPQRLLQSDFALPIATDRERERLSSASTPITHEKVQDYVCWRSSLLLIATILTVIASLVQIIGYTSVEDALVEGAIQGAPQGVSEADVRRQVVANIGKDNMDILNWWPILLVIGSLASALLMALAAWKWASIGVSRRLARLGWFVALGFPLIMGIIPWASMLDFKHAGPLAPQLKQMIAILFSMQAMFSIGPRLLSLFPGLMRSGMLLKTLFYESATPVYVTVLSAPVFVILALILCSVTIQVQAELTIFIGLGCYLLGALMYLVKSKGLARSHSADEVMQDVNSIRRTVSTLNIVGTLFLCVFLFQMDGLGAAEVISLLCFAGGNLLLTMVVSCDFLIPILRKEFEVTKAFLNSPGLSNFEKRMAAFSEAGLTRLRTSPTKPQ